MKRVQAKMVSTGGDRERWETKILVSEPRSSSEILEVIRNRISADRGMSGMYKPVAHIEGTPQVTGSKPWLKRVFTNERGNKWRGLRTIEAYPKESGTFMVTFDLARDLT